jgi:hypothetical protein
VIPASLLLIPLLLQAPDDGWGHVRSRPREVTRIYWELLKTTEVFVRLTPLDADGKPVRVNLVFHAFFSGPRGTGYVLGAVAAAEGTAGPTRHHGTDIRDESSGLRRLLSP